MPRAELQARPNAEIFCPARGKFFGEKFWHKSDFWLRNSTGRRLFSRRFGRKKRRKSNHQTHRTRTKKRPTARNQTHRFNAKKFEISSIFFERTFDRNRKNSERKQASFDLSQSSRFGERHGVPQLRLAGALRELFFADDASS